MVNELRKNKLNNVAVWGTFDLLHSGQKTFLKEASKYGNLNVIIIPQSIVYENKGYLPIFSEHKRFKSLESLTYVENVYVDSLSNGLTSLKQIDPTMFILGYDQKTVWERKLKDWCILEKMNIKFKHLSIYSNGIHCKNIRDEYITR